MKTLDKIINPCTVDGHQAFCKITITDGVLLIHGVIGPTRSGRSKGSAGQCVDDIRNGVPNSGWYKEMLEYFCDIWDEWHANDARPDCEHQRALHWRQLARKRATLYEYSLSTETYSMMRTIQREALQALAEGKAVKLTDDQRKIVNLKYEVCRAEPEVSGDLTEFYRPPIELKKELGVLRPSDHPDGILTKPCPVCGYKYGSEWRRHELPPSVVDWLTNLPSSRRTPAWI